MPTPDATAPADPNDSFDAGPDGPEPLLPSQQLDSGRLDDDLWQSWGPWRWPLLVLGLGAAIVGLITRFWTRSALWLDEALSVNIASLPLGDITGALRRDGHPPLYYYLLHGWMDLFGDSNLAVRSFSGLWSLALVALLWVAATRLGGRRVAVFTMIVLAVNPYAVRYATETRMYAMVSVLVLAWALLADDIRRGRRSWARLVAMALLVAAALWTHYWSMWFFGAAGLALVVIAWRQRRRSDADLRTTMSLVGSIVAGGVLFLPWLPSLLEQGRHTGTPWARPMRPTEILDTTLSDVGGGGISNFSEARVLGLVLALAMVLGLFGIASGRLEITLDLRGRRQTRPLAYLVAAPLAIGCLAGYASGATFASRYAAVVFPFMILLAAVGVSQFRSRPVALGVLAVFVILGSVGTVRNVIVQRTDAAENVAAIEAAGTPGDWVVLCPDQLGPAVSRLLPDGFETATYPAFGRPQLVDWTDYTERLHAVSPDAFADDLIQRAEGHRIFVIFSTNYETHEQVCPALIVALQARRPGSTQLVPQSEAFEQAAVIEFPAAS